QATVRSCACAAMAGAAVPNLVPAVVLGLSKRALRSAMLAELGMASFVLLLVSLGAVAALESATRALGSSEQQPKGGADVKAVAEPIPAAPTKTIPPTGGQATVAIRGRVVGADGAPVDGAQIILSRPRRKAFEIRSSEPLAKTGPDG